MRIRRLLSTALMFVFAMAIAISCARDPASDPSESPSPTPEPRAADAPLIVGYSNWSGWWPWAIAEAEGLFEANGANIQLKWFDGYVESMEALATGEIDGNCQTLSDTISFAGDAVHGEVAVLVNDNSAGNDKIIVSSEINTIVDLPGKKVAVEEGIVDDFLLTLALEEEGLSRDDVDIVPLETPAAVEAFVSGQTDAVGAFAPYWLKALERPGAKELISSAEFPGAIPDLLVVTAKAIEERPSDVQGLIDTWFDILAFVAENPKRAKDIMAERAGVSLAELDLLKQGTRMFSLQDNLEAFAPGDNMEHMQFAAQTMAKFMVNVDFIPKIPDLAVLFDDSFIQDYADRTGDKDTSAEDVKIFSIPIASPPEDTEAEEDALQADIEEALDEEYEADLKALEEAEAKTAGETAIEEGDASPAELE